MCNEEFFFLERDYTVDICVHGYTISGADTLLE